MSPSILSSSAAAAVSRGAAVENHGAGEKPFSPTSGAAAATDELEIREVWSDNLDSEFLTIREIIDEYPIVAMDTEFPGVVVRVMPSDVSAAETNYLSLAANVNLLQLLQLGLAFASPTGVVCPCVWQFNFAGFNPKVDIHNAGSLQLLEKAGVDFELIRARGIDVGRFAELLMSSGAVLNEEVSWVTFHGGYDIGYLLKALTGSPLPDSLSGFLKLVNVFFPCSYDVKHLMRFCGVNLHGGLATLAAALGVVRVGASHQAGSDSLITLHCYLAIVERFLRGNVEKYAGVLYGMGEEYHKPVK